MIEELLIQLKLFGALEFYKQHFEEKVDPQVFLQEMLKKEKERRFIGAQRKRLLLAKFPYIKEWAQIDEAKNPMIPFKKIKNFSNGNFIVNKTNLCLIGTPGLGKTHCLVSIGRDLCRLGMNVKFYTACDLVNQLEEAKNNFGMTKFMEGLLRPQLLIIDELGFVPFSENGARLLFDVFSKRYEKGSIAISTNLSFEKWPQIFGSIELTTALIDRFTHNCEIFTFPGDSIRLEESKNRKRN